MSFRRVLRGVRYGAIGGCIGVGLILTPPRETLPNDTLLHARVLLEGMGRVLRCAKTGVIILVDYKFHTWGQEENQEVWNEIHRRSAQKLVHLAETNGGLYVKSGQVFASMSHILPREYTDTMRVLQDAVVKRPYSEIEAVLTQDLKKPLSEIFSEFDEKPLAAASLAQVHKATLRSDGTVVAVKVQYIDIQQRFRGDLATIKLMLGVCGAAFPGYDFSSIVTRLDATMAQELDFIAEGKNGERAGRELAPIFGRKVVTPYIHWEYASPRVLITDFVFGVKISDREGMEKLGINVAEAADLCYSALAYQMFCTGFAHGDPHAGNILVHRPLKDGRNSKRGETQVVILDHGLYVEMPPLMRNRLARLWTSSVTHDNEALAMVSNELTIKDSKMLASMFLMHPYEYFSSFKQSMSTAELALMHNQAKEKMNEINDIIEHLPSQYALILRSLTAIRAINKDLGNPVKRPLVLLRYSMREAHAGWWTFTRAFVKAWYEETVNDITMRFLQWYQPELFAVVEDALAMA